MNSAIEVATSEIQLADHKAATCSCCRGAVVGVVWAYTDAGAILDPYLGAHCGHLRELHREVNPLHPMERQYATVV